MPHNSCGLINLSRPTSAARCAWCNRPLRTRLSSNDDGTSICSPRESVSGVSRRKPRRFFVSGSIRLAKIESGVHIASLLSSRGKYGQANIVNLRHRSVSTGVASSANIRDAMCRVRCTCILSHGNTVAANAVIGLARTPS